MLNRAKDRRVSMPLVPRSMTRDEPAGLAFRDESAATTCGHGRRWTRPLRATHDIAPWRKSRRAIGRRPASGCARSHRPPISPKVTPMAEAATALWRDGRRSIREWPARRWSPQSRAQGRPAKPPPSASDRAVPSATDRAAAYRAGGSEGAPSPDSSMGWG